MIEEEPPGNGMLREIRELCADRQFLVVSNREPYEHVHTKSSIAVHQPAGGLVSALDPVLRQTGGTWIAWKADRPTATSWMNTMQ